MSFQPDYRHLVDAARNRAAARLPLYEHNISDVIIEALTGREVSALMDGDLADKTEGFRRRCQFAADYGYDCIAFEGCPTSVVQGGLGLMGQAEPIIRTLRDVDAYPWTEKLHAFTARFRPDFDALHAAMPAGMKAVGGIGNGMFELIQDFVPLQDLAFLQVDEPEAYARLWERLGAFQLAAWTWLLDRYADDFAVCRFGDDLGFRSSTLIHPDEIRAHVIPHYKPIIDLVHARGKPFLLHSCGRIYDVMDDLISVAGIDAKHSNEDGIDLFDVWVERYGDRIGNFGGIEMNIMTLNTPDEVAQYVRDLLARVAGRGGIAIGTGNQIASYCKPANFVAMTEAVRAWRGERSESARAT
jgi:uroporphyrinogen decarboxylase